MDIVIDFTSHPEEERLEEYAFRRISEDQAAGLEEHLLICSRCQEKLAQADDYIQAFKFVSTHPAKPSLFSSAPALWRGLTPMPVSNLAGALVIVGLAGFTANAVRKPDLPTPSPASVQLVSFRGGERESFAHAGAGRPLVLLINAGDVPAATGYRLEIVGTSGSREWSGAPVENYGSLATHVAPGLPAGMYWVRLYAPGYQILTEYGLRLE